MARKRIYDKPEGAVLFPRHENHTLAITRLTKAHVDADKREVHALDRFSLTVDQPEIIGIVGPSGCGKSTLLRMIAGFDMPSAGSIVFDGEPVRGASYHRSMMFQNANLFDWLTVAENIAFGLRARGVYKEESWKIPEFISLMGLQGFEDSYPSQISGGMMSRCALARAYIQNPGLTLLDEPLSALDALTRNNLQEQIISMQRMAQNIVLLVTHDIEEAVFMCDRILVLSARPGRVVAEARITMEHPRDRVSDDFVDARRQLLGLLYEDGSA